MPRCQGTVLLADDEETFLEATQDLLQEEGYTCHSVRNADELGKALQSPAEFDILVTDLNMPGNHVMDMVNNIRLQSNHLPVVVVTGYPSLPSAVESVRLRVLEYFIKPVNYPSLLEAIKNGVQHKQLMNSIKNAQKEATERLERLSAIEETLKDFGTTIPDQKAQNALVEEPSSHDLALQVDATLQALSELNTPDDSHQDSPRESLLATDYYRLREAMFETIQVLQKTKSAFRSKDLAMLRKKLEEVLQKTSTSLKKSSSRSDSTPKI